MRLRKVFVLLLSLIAVYQASAQELSCKVTINTSQLATNTQQNDKQFFADLEQAVFNFINNQRWTNDVFAEKEKVKCNLVINLLKSPAQNRFIGNAQFQVIRPVYGTTYETVTFQFVDRAFEFSFAPEERQMVFNEQGFTNKLTSMLSYYSLLALAIDYDTFSRLGGSQYLERAYNVCTIAGNSGGGEGWSANSDMRNRYWIIENLRNQQLLRFREGLYNYHRVVLDGFASNPAAARKQVIEFLQTLKNIVSLKQNAVVINYFFDAKSIELINIFSEATSQEKQQVFSLLSNMDPDKTEAYRQILK
jgi:hypothetical protein